MTASQVSWLPRLERACLEATVVPMVGGLPPFPKETLEKALRELLHLSSVELTLSDPIFLEPEQSAERAADLEHRGPASFCCHARPAPLSGTASLVIEAASLWSLMHAALGRPVEGLVPLVDHDMNEGFGTFVMLAILQALDKAAFPPKTRLEVVEHADGLASLLLQGALIAGEQTWPFEVYVSQALMQSLRQTMTPQPLASLNPALAQILDLCLDLPVGRVDLPWNQFKKLKSGDVVILDQLDLDLASGDGTVLLRVGSQDVWSCRLSNGQLIADQPFPAHSEDRAMSFTPNSDDELFGELDEMGSFADYDLGDVETPAPAKGTAAGHPAKEPKVPSKASKEGVADKVHVQLTVSLGRLSLTARELFELKSGNVLNFPIQTSGAVDLLVGADLVGRGELVQLGDAIGVRIVEL
jgi:flagellar motor switch protein FliN/FliY